MTPTVHLDFVSAAYVAAVIIIGGLILWIALDYRAQRRILIELDRQGVVRRSAAANANRTSPDDTNAGDATKIDDTKTESEAAERA